MSENLLMLRFVCATVAANVVLASAVAAQSPVTKCESLQQSENVASDRTFLGLKDCYNCHTNGFPKDGFGDRFGIMANDSWILANEVKTWGETDKHAQAYTSLLSATGTKIGKALGVEGGIHRDKRCLACHTGFPIGDLETVDGQIHGLVDENMYKEDMRLTTGVSCESCHGQAGGTQGWLSAHTSKESWRFLAAENKCEKGFYDVRSVISRTRLCLSCHLGNAAQGRVLTHEMYAAGHPPLPAFEIETFESQMPRHWRHLSEKAELHTEFLEKTGGKASSDELHRTKSLLVAALISRSESLRLTADLAEGAVSEQIPKPQWPDFAQFDCYACHHDLKTESWRQIAQHSGSPGRPVLLPWPETLAQLAAVRIADSDDTDRDFAAVRSATLMSPFGDREMLIKAARASASSGDRLALALDGQEMTIQGATSFLEQIVEMAATESLDYDSARLLVWAFAVVQDELRLRSDTGVTSPLIDETLTSVQGMFVLSLKDGREEKHRIPGAPEPRSVKEVDLKTVLLPIANYDAIAFQKAFAELRQRNQSE